MKRTLLFAFFFSFSAVSVLPFDVFALESPKQIGYYCSPQTSSIVEGQYYILQSDPCTYLSASLSFGPRVGNLYRGTIGSSTAIGGHGLGFSSVSDQFGDAAKDEAFNIQQGEDMFIAIFRDFNGSQSTQFNNYFRTGAGTIPHDDYGFIRFKYGVAPPPEPDEPDPVIIIPGILGSEKNSAGEWIIDPILHTYDDLIATLDANGYTPDVDLFPFPYNWRKSNVETALLLKEKINEVKDICQCDKVDLVAHSMGGLAARQYIQSDAYDQDVDQLIFLGTPHLGAPKAYLMWEGGEFGNDIYSFLIEILLAQEAKENGYDDLFSYVRDVPIDAVQQLLPTYDYIFDVVQLRNYPTGYPINSFLEQLNSQVSSLLNSGVAVSNITGDTGSNQSIVGITATDSTSYLPKWKHGYPELILGSGDGTVPTASASFLNVTRTLDGTDHITLPGAAEGRVFEILTGSLPATEIHDFQLVNVRMIVFKMLSPADLLITAPDGKKIGKENGQEVNEIPSAFYTGFNNDTEYITILNPLDGEYKVFTEGTDTGSYTVETAFINDDGVSESSFTGNTVPGLVTELNVPIDTQNPQPDIQPEDTDPPVISIVTPESRDYLRSEQLPVEVSAIDDGAGLHSLQTQFDGETIPNIGSIDLFFKPLGNHTVSASSTDNVNNEATESKAIRVTANATSTRDDMSRAYSLSWMTKKIYDDLLKKFNACYKQKTTLTSVTKTVVVAGKNGKPPTTKKIQEKVTKVEIYFDKNTAKDMLKTLDKYRGKGLNEEGYLIIKEDVQWLINS